MRRAQALDLFKATVMLLSDFLPPRVDSVFFHSRARGDEDGLFELISELYTSGRVRNIVINGSEGQRVGGSVAGESWPGRNEWKNRLKSLGANRVFLAKPAFQTREENDAFIQLAKEKDCQSAVVVAQPHQLLRIMLGAIISMQQTGYLMKIYARAPQHTSWEKEVYGSQGARKLKRSKHVDEEFKRILTYQKTGELAQLTQLIEYLEWRNSRV